MKVLADYQSRLTQLLKEQAGDLDPNDKDAAIAEAVREHSRLKPYKKLHEFTGDGAAFDFVLGTAPGPTDWEKDFSKILQVEFPAGERNPVYLEDEDYQLYEKITGEVLRFLSDTPGTGQKALVNYTARHSVTASAGTIPEPHFDAVCHLAAAIALNALANRYIQNTEPTLGADSVDHKSKAFEARQAAREERKLYFQHLGIKESDVPAGFAVKDLDVNYPWGEDRLTHPRRWR